MAIIYDAIVVGSGPSGVQAAQTLIEKGFRVGLVDAGISDDYYSSRVPKNDFLSLRETDHTQHEYFLGRNFEYLSFNKVGTGSQLTPSRQFLIKEVTKWLSLESDTFKPLQSLALGGLGSGWGNGCFVFSDNELDQVGLERSAMKSAYQTIANRIGISGAADDIFPYTIGNLKNILPALKIDSHCKSIYERYENRKNKLHQKGFFMGRTPLAILSENFNERPGHQYQDMDFWSNSDESIYRPGITLKSLQKNPNFTYINEQLLLTFQETESGVTLRCKHIRSNENTSFACRNLFLAAGAINTGRIVLRSLGNPDTKLPLLCNAYSYIVGLDFRSLQRLPDKMKSSMSQLTLFHDDNLTHTHITQGSLYTYRSLLISKLVKDMPFNFRVSRKIAQLLQSCMVITGVFFPESARGRKSVQLKKDPSSPTGDKLSVQYESTAEDEINKKIITKKFEAALWNLGLIPIRTLDPGAGASIHYAGTLPMNGVNTPFSVDSKGKLKGCTNTYVVDGSGFNFLPGKGLTLSLMANAHRVADNASIGK